MDAEKREETTNTKKTNEWLFEEQKRLLDTYLEHGAITQAQHDYSLNCLIQKMKPSRK